MMPASPKRTSRQDEGVIGPSSHGFDIQTHPFRPRSWQRPPRSWERPQGEDR
jgi:hypothetical protein